MYKPLVIGAMFLLLLAGCSRSAQTKAPRQQQQEAFVFDWKLQTFRMNEKVTEERQLQMKTYREWEHNEKQEGNTYSFSFYATDGTSFFTGIEECVYTEDLSKILSVAYWKEAMNPMTGEVTSVSVTKEEFDKLFGEPKEAGLLPPIRLYTAEDSQAMIMGATYSDDGELVYAVYESAEQGVLIKWYDEEAKKEKVLGELPFSELRSLLGMQGADLYYATMSNLVRWNVLTGERSNIFSFEDNGIRESIVKQLAFGEDGILYLRCIDKNEDWMTELTLEDVVQGVTVRLADIAGCDDYTDIVREAAAIFSRKNPQNSLEFEKNETDIEAYRTRILADVTAEKGPDILLVTREDMKLLYEKGWTADLREYLSEETLDELLPGVIQMGTVEETLIGLTPQVSVRAMFTTRSVWNKDSWTVSDVIELVEKNRDQKSIMVDAIDEEISSGTILRNFALWDLQNSLFINWEKRESNFDREEFVKLLEVCKNYESSALSKDNKAQMLQEGKCLAFSTSYMGDFRDFVEMADMAGTNFYPIGFPSETGSANYLEDRRMLVVNRNAKNKQAISDFLEYLFGKEAQEGCIYYSVRKNPLEEQAVNKDEFAKDSWLYEKRMEKHTIRSKSDVKAYVKDFNEFLESCKPVPITPSTLDSILWEELDVYFAGDRSAKDTAEMIDNRVQLYLDEEK